MPDLLPFNVSTHGGTMSRVSNRQLVEELQSGNRLGCTHLVEVYHRRLLYECIRVFEIDPRDSEEIVDDVLLSVVQKIGTFSFKKSDSDFHYWIMTIFRNKVRDFVRRRVVLYGSAGPSVGLYSPNGNGEDDEASGLVQAAIREYERSVLEDDDKENPLAWVEEVLDTMHPWERVLLRCRALDVPYNDIARYTDKTAEQLKVYHPRVKKRFQRILAERAYEKGVWVPHDAKKKTTKAAVAEATSGG